MYNNNIDIITESVTMQMVLDKYGIKYNAFGKACCPIHNEKTPSFSIYADGKKFKCFGCDANGSVIDFIKAYEHIDTRSAITLLDNYFGLGLVYAQDKKMSLRAKREHFRRILQEQAEKEAEKQAEKDRYDEYIYCHQMLDNYNALLKKSIPGTTEFAKILKQITRLEIEIENFENERGAKWWKSHSLKKSSS